MTEPELPPDWSSLYPCCGADRRVAVHKPTCARPRADDKPRHAQVLMVPADSIEMLRETFCVAQYEIAKHRNSRRDEHIARLQRLINECDRQRPLGPDGKHGDRHTPTCGCEDTGGNAP